MMVFEWKVIRNAFQLTSPAKFNHCRFGLENNKAAEVQDDAAEVLPFRRQRRKQDAGIKQQGERRMHGAPCSCLGCC